MKKEIIIKLSKRFEEATHIEQGIEFWMARDIQELLEYNEWRNFLNVIEKAKIACKNSGQPENNHFGEVNKMVKLGSGSEREIPDIMLSRFACYLIAQNATDARNDVGVADPHMIIKRFFPEHLP
jgi:DNA-damage-inducible protein D